MKSSAKALSFIAIGVVSIWLVVNISPLFLDSKIERLSEEGLPTVTIENRTNVYCRMQADDFRFKLPREGIASEPQITASGFDSIEGTLIVSFPNKPISLETYQSSILTPLQSGGTITVTKEPYSSSLRVNFSYFGDR